jgi:hypothetical protein
MDPLNPEVKNEGLGYSSSSAPAGGVSVSVGPTAQNGICTYAYAASSDHSGSATNGVSVTYTYSVPRTIRR